MATYEIRVQELSIIGGSAAHLFIAFYEDGQFVTEFNGLATDPSGQVKEIGYPWDASDILKVYQGHPRGTVSDPAFADSSDIVNAMTIYSSTDVNDWNARLLSAQLALEQINAQQLDYELLDQNSNSAAETLLRSMDLEIDNNQLSGALVPGRGNILISDDQLNLNKSIANGAVCFLSGTLVDMWDGSSKAIELIETDDVVASYDPDEADGRGALKPGRVVRTYRNTARHILDVHGLMVTPGHVTLCGEGRFAGRHVAIMDILRSDGALVTGDGSLVRAATNCPVGSRGDELIWAVAGHAGADGVVTVTDKGRIRLGTRLLLDDGRDCSVLDIIEAQGWVITDDGMLKETSEGTECSPFVWPLGERLPRPEDYVLARSRLTLNDVYGPGEWEAMAPAASLASAPGETQDPSLRVSRPGAQTNDTRSRTFRGEARH